VLNGVPVTVTPAAPFDADRTGTVTHVGS
jgi:hypothetical protein